MSYIYGVKVSIDVQHDGSMGHFEFTPPVDHPGVMMLMAWHRQNVLDEIANVPKQITMFPVG